MFGDLADVLRKGGIVADPAAWKKRQVTATILAGFVISTLHLFGVQFPAGIQQSDIDAVAAGLIGAVNIVLTYATTDKIGILPAKREAAADPGKSVPDDGASGA